MEWYITNSERCRCRKVADAFEELYEENDIVVLDAGRYGFVKLQYYKSNQGFDATVSFADAISLFEDLWQDWYCLYLMAEFRGTPYSEMEYDEMFLHLSAEKQSLVAEKRRYFAGKAGIEVYGEKDQTEHN